MHRWRRMLLRRARVDTLPPDSLPPEAFPAMKIRTCLLAAFGLVVPLIAMFSHLIPSGATDAVWAAAWQPASAFFAADASDTTATAAAAAAPTEAAGLLPTGAETAATPLTQSPPRETDRDATLLAGGVASDTPPSNVVLPTVNVSMNSPGSDPRTTAAATVRRPTGEVESPLWSADSNRRDALVTPAATTTAAAPSATAGSSATAASPIEQSLNNLGAFDVACQPTAGGRYFHCSCRVAADPTGQLVRMFHATEPDQQRAMQRLLDDVGSWKARQAATSTAPPVSPPMPSGGTILR